MPIIIDDNNNVQTVNSMGKVSTPVTNPNASPKFFHKTVLTGRGGMSKGLIVEKRNPLHYIKNGYKQKIATNLRFGTTHNGNVKIYNLPFSIITDSMWERMTEFKRPSLSEMTKIATHKTRKSDIYLWMPIFGAVVDEVQTPSATAGTTTVKDMSISMHAFLFNVVDAGSETHKQTSDTRGTLVKTDKNLYSREIIFNMNVLPLNYKPMLEQNDYIVDIDVMKQFIAEWDIYTEICKAAQRWLTESDEYICQLIKNINTLTSGSPTNSWWRGNGYGEDVSSVLGRLENLSIPLDVYQRMYTKMKSIVSPDILNIICKANLNLKLANTLNNMNNNRASLNYCPCNNHINAANFPYSLEQRAAIESVSPLTLVQSGAGTGKSTVILGRIEHMLANGIKPEDITVISFTNAAANHINDMQPNVHSMTIASMLHTIYNANFPSHQLSSLATIINSIDIYYGSKSIPMTTQMKNFTDEFKSKLERLMNNNAYTEANNFVEDHVDDVITVLNTIEQTSLELESIICYLKMDTLIEPPETEAQHLIIDEVQDNSIAEFIYCIQYTEKHKNSLYIVGDCSQTLFEFRASNPKALNVLESSGVFQCYKLQTNYRSNQEILDFANVGLSNIEANRYANIQLYSNNLSPVTLQSFQNAVHINCNKMSNRSAKTITDTLQHFVAVDLNEYINDKLAKGEQVAFLAQRRTSLRDIEEVLVKLYPSNKLSSLIPVRQHDSAIFSRFIAEYWDKITYTPPNNILSTIRDTLMSKLAYYARGGSGQKMQKQASSMIYEFEQMYGQRIALLQGNVAMSTITQKHMLDEIKKLMISFEIKRNAIAQTLISSKNNEAKLAADVAASDFIISTIHSAKGLEFDNVVVFYDDEGADLGEDDKRMYYVAFTRAKKTEFICVYGTYANPKVNTDYQSIIKILTKKANNPNLASRNITLTDDDDDTVYVNEGADENNNTDIFENSSDESNSNPWDDGDDD